MNRLFFLMVLVGVPISVAGSLLNWSQILMFIIYCVTIIALSAFMGRATESLAIHAGPRIGGLLNATFGNAVELIISIFALKAGMLGVVLASLTGSIIGNLLLVAGLSFLVGGIRFKRPEFNVYDARHNSGLLIFSVVVAFIFPEVFSIQLSERETLTLSIWIAIIMIVLYIAALIFKLVTHRGVYQHRSDKAAHDEEAEWSKLKAILVLFAATLAVAYVSERLVSTFETVGHTFGWTELFIGVIIVAIVGNAAEHASAVIMAFKNKMNVAVEIAIGSSIQVAMFVAPVLVLISLLFSKPMPLIFTLPELVAMVLSVILTIAVSIDGETNWFEGLTMLAAYLIMGVGFYFL
ncbi:calcium/proton exchanger [Pueribacillus theae]|uniref:Ca(2+)/H(+) antiporter n=2 Tax=Pueribacillus theae TaxID=2171751 RepID=A0A2U1K604_9BACI|nr:calcium/proton exchanger [Pueribacillus theae]